MISVVHDPEHLPFKRVVPVWSTHDAYKKIQRMMDEKRPRGMRLRYGEDPGKKEFWLEARNALPVEVAYGVLRDAGMIRR